MEAIDVEDGAAPLMPVVRDSTGHCCVHLSHVLVRAFTGGRGRHHLGKGAELDVLGSGYRPFRAVMRPVPRHKSGRRDLGRYGWAPADPIHHSGEAYGR